MNSYTTYKKNLERHERRSRMTADDHQREQEIVEQIRSGTYVAPTTDAVSAKLRALRKANKNAKQNARRHRNTPRITHSEIEEAAREREYTRFMAFELRENLEKRLEKLPENEGIHISGNLFIGRLPATGDVSIFTYTKSGDDRKIYTYTTEHRENGDVKTTKSYRGTEIETTVRRSPFGKLPPRPTGFVAAEQDFPALGEAKSTPVVEKVQRSAPVDDFVQVTPKKHKTTAPKAVITLSPKIQERLAGMPANNGMIVRGKIHWGKAPKTKYPTFTATELRTHDGKRGVFSYTWGPRSYRESFKPQGAPWETLTNERGVDGCARMAHMM